MGEAMGRDLGSIKIHKKVLAQIACTALQDIKSVRPATGGAWGLFRGFTGIKPYPGVNVAVDKNNQVTVDVQIRVEYGHNVHEVARLAQDAVRVAIERTVEIDLKDVNVNIQGIDRGQK